MAQAQSPIRRRGARIVSLAAALPSAGGLNPASMGASGLVLCGNIQGDVFAFVLPPEILMPAPGAVSHCIYVRACGGYRDCGHLESQAGVLECLMLLVTRRKASAAEARLVVCTRV